MGIPSHPATIPIPHRFQILKHTPSFLFLALALPLLGVLGAEEPLVKQFQNPPDAVKPSCYWHWLNNHVDKQGITRDLEEFKAKGMGGATIYPVAGNGVPGNISFLSPEWRELFKHAVNEAARLGLELGVNMGAGWCVGGPWTTPEKSGRWFLQSELKLTGPQKFSGTLPLPGPKDGYDSPPQLQVANYINLPLEKVDYRNSAVWLWRKRSVFTT